MTQISFMQFSSRPWLTWAGLVLICILIWLDKAMNHPFWNLDTLLHFVVLKHLYFQSDSSLFHKVSVWLLYIHSHFLWDMLHHCPIWSSFLQTLDPLVETWKSQISIYSIPLSKAFLWWPHPNTIVSNIVLSLQHLTIQRGFIKFTDVR